MRDLLPSFFNELEKISVSSEWVRRQVTGAMAKGVKADRYTRFADRMVSKADRTFDKAVRSKNFRVHDNYNEALDTAQRWNPFDYPGGKGVKTASKSMQRAESFHNAEVKDWPGFEKDLRNKHFQKAMLSHDLTDEKLKKYVKNYGGQLQSKSIIAFAPSRSDKQKEYKIKVLPTGRLACECKDWQYHHSVRKSDCDHIKAVKHFYKAGLVKMSSAFSTIARGANLQRRITAVKELDARSRKPKNEG